MADFDRYLAACEDRDADRIRRYDDEREAREARMTRESDIYAKHASDIDRLMNGIHPDTGDPMLYDDEGRLLDEDAEDRESRLDRLATDAEYRSDCDRDREMEDRA